ncbi:MAG: hypothetical protein V4582_17375 [Pseudomonadota bacterium]
MKRLHLMLGAGLLGAAALAIFGDKTPVGVVQPVAARSSAGAPPRSSAPARATAAAATSAAAVAAAPASMPAVSDALAKAGADGPRVLALIARADLIGDGAGASGEAVFGSQNWNPPPPPPAPPPPPPPPSAPPLPFSFIGKAVSDGHWEVYLARGDRTVVVHNKDVIDGTYRVDAIAPPVLSLTYLPLNQVQQLNIGVLD